MIRVALPALIAMMAVAGFVGAGSWNASGEPGLVITLTERELELPFRINPGDEDPGLMLRIRYDARNEPLESRNWLSEQRLREIGFDLHVPAGSPDAVSAYDHVPARVAWVAFEYDGPQAREIERRRALTASHEPTRHGQRMWSRLVAVDAAASFDVLRARYPSGHLIMRGVIGLWYRNADNGGPIVHGHLREVVPQRVAVPHRLRDLFEGLRSAIQDSASEPRYEIDLAIGRLGLPYVVGVRRTKN
jgi:hypothetical protein